MIRFFSKILPLLLLSTSSIFAQNGVAMADVMRSNGKIYVVVAVLVLIFIGIALYLFRIERKIDKIDRKEEF